MSFQSIPPDRLFQVLNNTGLQNKDTPLYQLLFSMIAALQRITVNTGSGGGGGGGGSVTNNFNTIIQQILESSGDGGGDSDVIPGPAGAAGSAGATGAQGPMGNPGISIDDFPIEEFIIALPGPQGNPGIQGIAGSPGPPGFGVDGDDGDFIPALVGPQGNPGSTGATGDQGPIGPSIVTDDVIYPDDLIIPPSQSIAGSGGWELAATQALSGAAQYDFPGLGIYTDIIVRIVSVTAGTGMTTYLRVSIDNGSNFLSSSGDYVQVQGNGVQNNDTELEFYTTAATAARGGEIMIQGVNIANAPKFARSNFFSTDGVLLRYMPTTSAINAVRVLNSGAVNFTGGTAYVLGRRF